MLGAQLDARLGAIANDVEEPHTAEERLGCALRVLAPGACDARDDEDLKTGSTPEQRCARAKALALRALEASAVAPLVRADALRALNHFANDRRE